MEELNHYIFSYTDEPSDILKTDAGFYTVENLVQIHKELYIVEESRMDFVCTHLKHMGYFADYISAAPTIYDI